MTDPDPDRCAEDFRSWHRAALGSAARCQAVGDVYGAALAGARARTYREAADLVDQLAEVTDVVAVMLDRCGRSAVRTPPMVEFDPAGLRYITARAWQLCASTLDPGARVVQRSWDE